ncbi:MAG TPA: serine/threonine-protein kinase [Kofleriaceae bacterium]|nr:serine/threonine-protein kinase [Kofleriaceae bacterium]
MSEKETPTVVDKPAGDRPAATGSSAKVVPAALGSASIASGTSGASGVSRPNASFASGVSRPGTRIPSATATISEQAMAAVEAERMRGLLNGIAGSSAFVTLIVLLVSGDPWAQRVHAAALGVTAVMCATLALWFRNPKRYRPRVALYAILSQVVVLATGYYFWGFFSTYGALVPLTVYIAMGSATKTETILGTALLVSVQTSLGLALTLGYITPRGLVEPVVGRTDFKTQLIALALIQGITIGAAVAGRAAKRASQAALETHNQALLDLARREAQLAEAWADARAAREAGVGGLGRFTDQRIDDFELGEILGRGAMGEVYAAKTPGNHPVAVKILAPHLLRDPSARDRFLRESEIVSSINSPHVVKVLTVAPKDALVPYIAMERLEGTDLAQMLKKRSLLPLAEIEDIVTQVATGLDAAHKAGVIHRDLKPSNIFATGEASARVWKLLDFGASKWHDGEGTLTRDNVVGTPGYMAPEQALGRAVDQRSDVYALGVIMYRLMTGVPAVVPGEVPAMLQEVSFKMPVQPSKRAKVSPALEAVLAVALAKSPVHRFSTAGDLAAAFRAAAAGKLDRAIQQRAEAVLADLPWDAWNRR